MSKGVMLNSNFLDGYLSGRFEGGILPIEEATLMARIDEEEQRIRVAYQQKALVAGGDDWHDGQFKASDEEVNRAEAQKRSLKRKLDLPVVGLPDISETRVSLGSLVVINGGLYEILGTNVLGESNHDGLLRVTLKSAIGELIVGQEVDTNITFRGKTLKIEEIQPALDLELRV